MPFSVLDLVVLGVVVISALLAAVRGFTREVLAIVAWVVAAALAWKLHPMLQPIVAQHVSSETVSRVGSIAAIFLVTLLVVSIITVKVSDLILDSRIGAIDRSLGLAFGAARGFLICVIGWVFLAWLVQGKVPDWAQQARAKDILDNTGQKLVAMLPGNPDELLKQFRKPKPETDPGTDAPAEGDAPPQRRTDATPARR
jgi:membrane protein required for colicin V production